MCQLIDKNKGRHILASSLVGTAQHLRAVKEQLGRWGEMYSSVVFIPHLPHEIARFFSQNNQ